MDIQFIRTLPIPACSVSPEGIITNANPLMKNVFVYDDIVGTNFFTMTGFKRDQLMQANEEEKVLERNGKLFKLYKFRTMYADAEERKKELMSKNRVKDGMMFKLDFDERIIGSKKLKNGKIKKGFGGWLRALSIDECPQFFNVLKGDMSLVGTRPPTLDEWEKYELHHRARLAIKPGLTGMWQVSGRSKITDFEEVVRLDTMYIREWRIILDIKILCKTMVQVFKREGSM